MRRFIPIALIVMVALAIPAVGQEIHPTPRGERIIEALLIWRLVDELDLTDAQIARIFPRIKGLKDIRLEMGRRVPPLLREIRIMTRQVPRDDEAIRIKVTELNQLRVDMETRRRRQLQGIATVLTPEQLGKFALVQETFEIETLRLLQEARRVAEEQLPPRR